MEDQQEGHPNDVFLLCKQFMHSSSLTQKPTLILPASRAMSLNPLPEVTLERNKLSDRQVAEFRKTARAISEPPWKLERASEYLSTLCDENQSHRVHEPPPLVFFRSGPEDLQRLQAVRDQSGPPEELLTFAPGTPRKVVASMRPILQQGASEEIAAGRGARGRGRGRGRQPSRGRGRGRGKGSEAAAADAKGDAEVELPEVDLLPRDDQAEPVVENPPAEPQEPRQRKKRTGLKRPAAAVEESRDPTNGDQSEAPAPVVAEPPAPDSSSSGYVLAPSGKRYRQSTVDTQTTLGCSKCVMAKNGCRRCIEIHNLWKAQNNVS